MERRPARIAQGTLDVAAVGTGVGAQREHGRFRFAHCDTFTFRGDLIALVESYLVSLPGQDDSD